LVEKRPTYPDIPNAVNLTRCFYNLFHAIALSGEPAQDKKMCHAGNGKAIIRNLAKLK
jgi:hypothetical protein